ncbi:MAG: hypothetical protein NW241_05815 [Bacteroidia bacterium]|nr:hypothetical protein [Bacteroidia bacterium]
MNRLRLLFLPAAWLMVLAACKPGELLDNRPPDTRLFVDSIRLSGESRLNSVVRLHWLGEDPDGYVRGYEWSADGSDWFYTVRTDSTFRFELPAGSDTADFRFFVRAIDNLGLADPEPARLTVPVKNEPPFARFDTINALPDTVLPVLTALWTAGDLDGGETLDSLFIRLNGGPWYALSAQTRLITLIAASPQQAGSQQARILAGAEARELPRRLDGLQVDGVNRLYVRARDIAGAFSPADSTGAFFMRRQRGDLLVIDAHGEAAPDSLYRNILNARYPNYDWYNLRAQLPGLWDPTFRLLLAQYDKVFWYGDDVLLTSLNNQLLLEAAAGPLQRYLNGGGKLLITAKFPPLSAWAAGNGSAVFGFSPMDSVSSSTGQARMPTGSRALPAGLFAGGDTLAASSFITGADPFYAKDPGGVIYTGELTPVGGWQGPAAIAALGRFTNGSPNQVFFSIELHRLSQRRQSLERMLDRILNQEFNW